MLCLTNACGDRTGKKACFMPYNQMVNAEIITARTLLLYAADPHTNCRNSSHDLSQLQLVQYGRLTSCIKTNHKNAHFLLGKKPTKELGECEPHSAYLMMIPTPQNYTIKSYHFCLQNADPYVDLYQVAAILHMDLNDKAK